MVLLSDPSRPVLAAVVEVQLRRAEDKRWVWPEYLTALRRRLRCPTVLLVVCLDRATAQWAGVPIELGDGASRVVARVLGPDAIPVLLDPVQAAGAPELAVLSTLVHVGEHGPFEVLDGRAPLITFASSRRSNTLDLCWPHCPIWPGGT